MRLCGAVSRAQGTKAVCEWVGRAATTHEFRRRSKQAACCDKAGDSDDAWFPDKPAVDRARKLSLQRREAIMQASG